MKNIHYFLFIAIVMILFTWSCKKDDSSPKHPPVGTNEGEVITSVIVQVSDSAGIWPAQTFKFRDLDGAGGSPPVQFDTIRIPVQTTLLVHLILLDETKLPADTISNDILDEAVDHLFFFEHTGVDIITTYLDSDSNGLPLGLDTKWVTGTAATGTSRIILKHQPGVKDGTITPGATDVDVTFNCELY
ncbi:MAG TPA: hypothetical protein VFW78_00895 [Bacteroidia bacterium]|nr:hypothetical protein [Bacteroidia bacterium]